MGHVASTTPRPAGDVSLHHWRLSFRESAPHPIPRVLRDGTLRICGLPSLTHHAAAPVGFRRLVTRATRKPLSSELLPAARGSTTGVKRRTELIPGLVACGT